MVVNIEIIENTSYCAAHFRKFTKFTVFFSTLKN